MGKVIVGVGGTITAILFSIGIITDLNDVSSIASMMFGNHTPDEWNELTANFISGSFASGIITMLVYLFVSLTSKNSK